MLVAALLALPLLQAAQQSPAPTWIPGLGVIVLLMGVASVACWVPAWRAARIDPVITLKSE